MSQAGVIEEVRLIFADADANHNKCWHGYLFANGDVKVEWGRVGYNLQTKTHVGAGASKLQRLKSEKLAKGYTEQRTVAAAVASAKSGNGKPVAKSSLKDVVARDLCNLSDECKKLMLWLAEVNVHNIVSNTTISYNEDTGQFSTPLGLVTVDGLADARSLLNQMAMYVQKKNVEDNQFKRLCSEYLRIVPQNIGMARGWHETMFGRTDLLTKQYDLLDSLDASLQQTLTAPKADGATAKAAEPERVFTVGLDIVNDSKTIDRIRKKFMAERGNHYDVKDLDVKLVYGVHIPPVREAYEKYGKSKVGNIMQLWHGTKASNLLSILKGGLIIPASSAGFVTGRMFGDGLYFSDQSTKSLRYATNAWTHGGNTQRTFMFLCDVAMGKYYVPSGPTSLKPPHGYDSYYAQASRSGVMNNEMIVPRTDQADLVYLIEFTKYGK